MLASLGALGFYMMGALGQGMRIRGGAVSRKGVLAVTTLGAAFQTLALYWVIHTPRGINLGIFVVASLTMLMVTLVVVFSSLRKPADSLLLLIVPVTMASTLAAWLTPLEHIVWRPPSAMVAHVLISVLAYGILMVVAFQSLLLAYQEHQLRHHHPRRIIQALPPLQTMERLMFDFLLVGVILLSLSLISGFVFLDDMFAQHLIHKTLLSLAAWCIFALLLAGHWLWGWRGLVVRRWIVAGVLLLGISYFGWRLAIDLLVQ